MQASLAGAFSVFMVLAAPAQALEWNFSPSISATATFSDNVKQSETNTESGGSFTLRPGFTLQSEGSRRIEANIGYGLSAVTRFGGSDGDNLYHNLGSSLKAELVEDFFFVDANASVSQQLLSLFGSPADATTNDSNRATVGTFSVSPHIKKRLGSFAEAQARYTLGGSIFGDNAASDSTINALSAGLTSGPQFNDLSWGLNYSLREANNRTLADSTFESATATLGYALTRKFRVFGTVGEDRNDFISNSGTDGSSYSLGFGWSPTRRTTVEMSAGERFFGKTFSFNGRHETRRSRWSVNYAENVSDISAQLAEESQQTYWVCDIGNGLAGAFSTELNPTPPLDTCLPQPVTPFQLAALGADLGGLIESGAISISTANGVFIIKSLNAGVSWTLRRFVFGLTARDTRRFFQLLGNAEDRVQGVTGTVSYRLTSRTRANGSVSLSRNQADAQLTGTTARNDDLMSLSLGLSHRFAEKLNGALTFRHTQRDSNDATADYDENSVSASVSLGF
ncbi:MAG TPA: TIGR03016 family PEP-CTERM system-associated outer membrane protein [Thiobacillus sp.]|nr:TIGR03016 family PEP-CTERM system-associated outer membrane protein [Thiobacillus sp.]